MAKVVLPQQINRLLEALIRPQCYHLAGHQRGHATWRMGKNLGENFQWAPGVLS
jgi:hypothetical protein